MMDLYIVMAYRFGGTDNVFPIGVFSTHEEAVAAAKWHHDRRGGKYEHRILPFLLGTPSDRLKSGVPDFTLEQRARLNKLEAGLGG